MQQPIPALPKSPLAVETLVRFELQMDTLDVEEEAGIVAVAVGAVSLARVTSHSLFFGGVATVSIEG